MKTPHAPPGRVSDTLGVSALGPGPSQEGPLCRNQEAFQICQKPATHNYRPGKHAAFVKGLREDDCHSADFT